MNRIPFIVYGDGPRLPTGLARIARDLMTRLYLESDSLGIRLAQLGVDYPGGWHWQGWDFFGFQPAYQNQGRREARVVIEELTRETGERPIVLMIMDPARCFDLIRDESMIDPNDPDSEVLQNVPSRLPADFWGYFPLDAHNSRGSIGGPAAQAVYGCQRIIAYGAFGAQVLKATIQEGQAQYLMDDRLKGPVPWLPHGIETHVFAPGVPLSEASSGFQAWAQTIAPGTLKIGCVATNQPRKDLGLLCATVAHIEAQGIPTALWIHTDKLTNAWDIGELVRSCGLKRGQVAASIAEESDRQLAARYCWSDVTIAPGLGEGFGYPIVESLACGTPVVHGNYAGGRDLVPDPQWLIDIAAWRLESVYAVMRPVFDPKRVAAAVLAIRDRQLQDPTVLSGYCRGSIAYLDWRRLWPRWRSWIAKGLHERRRATTHDPGRPDDGAGDDPLRDHRGLRPGDPGEEASPGGDRDRLSSLSDAVEVLDPRAPPRGGTPGA